MAAVLQLIFSGQTMDMKFSVLYHISPRPNRGQNTVPQIKVLDH